MKIFTILLLTILLSFTAFGQSRSDLKSAGQFTATSIDGKTFDLDELKGKVVVLTFWGTYCPYCIQEIPDLNEMAKKYKDKEVVFIAISAENESSIKKFIKKKPFNFNLISNGFEIMGRYAAKDANGNFKMPTPTHFVINGDGNIELKIVGYDKSNRLENTVARLLEVEED